MGPCFADLPTLLEALIQELPSDGRVRLRVGMTNPPFILEHLSAIARCLRHPYVFSYLHIPVQAGSDSVLEGMNREYTSAGELLFTLMSTSSICCMRSILGLCRASVSVLNDGCADTPKRNFRRLSSSLRLLLESVHWVQLHCV